MAGEPPSAVVFDEVGGVGVGEVVLDEVGGSGVIAGIYVSSCSGSP